MTIRPKVSTSAGAIGSIALVLMLSAFAWVFWPPSPVGRADPDDPDQVALGASLYRQHCGACHGAKLEGQPKWRTRKPDGKLPAPPHDGTGHTWHHSDELLFRLTRTGVKPPLAPDGYKSDMPAFEGVLNDEQIWAVLAFIKSQWPSTIRERQERVNEASRQP